MFESRARACTCTQSGAQAANAVSLTARSLLLRRGRQSYPKRTRSWIYQAVTVRSGTPLKTSRVTVGTCTDTRFVHGDKSSRNCIFCVTVCATVRDTYTRQTAEKGCFRLITFLGLSFRPQLPARRVARPTGNVVCRCVWG